LGVWFQNDSKLVQIRRKINAELSETKLIKTAMTITIYWLETHHELSVPIGYPMVMALGLVAVVANVSAIKRLWSIVKALRVREKDGAEARTRAAEEILRQEQEGSEVSQQSANIRL
jgi:hypothetical protein